MIMLLLNHEDGYPIIVSRKIQIISPVEGGNTFVSVGGSDFIVKEPTSDIVKLLEATENGMSHLMNNGQKVAGLRDGKPIWYGFTEISQEFGV